MSKCVLEISRSANRIAMSSGGQRGQMSILPHSYVPNLIKMKPSHVPVHVGWPLTASTPPASITSSCHADYPSQPRGVERMSSGIAGLRLRSIPCSIEARYLAQRYHAAAICLGTVFVFGPFGRGTRCHAIYRCTTCRRRRNHSNTTSTQESMATRGCLVLSIR